MPESGAAVVCVDATPQQLVAEVREAAAMRPGWPAGEITSIAAMGPRTDLSRWMRSGPGGRRQ